MPIFSRLAIFSHFQTGNNCWVLNVTKIVDVEAIIMKEGDFFLCHMKTFPFYSMVESVQLVDIRLFINGYFMIDNEGAETP